MTTSAEATAVSEITGEPESETGALRSEQRRTAVRMRNLLFTLAILVAATIVILWPVWAAPLSADQRYMYLNAAGRVQGNWLDIIGIPWSEVPERAELGRVTPVGYMIQWFFYTGIMELSVATGTSVVVLHGAQKLLLLAAAILCVGAFVRSLRGRGPNGQLVAPSASTVWLVVAGAVVLGAVGTQTHLQFRNGWVSYPVLTYGAVIVGFGVPALTLWLTRRMAERPNVSRTTIAATAMVLVGLLLNVSYELYYVAFPAAVLALLLQPDPPDEGRRRTRVAKLVTGGTLSVAFLAAFVAIRMWTANACGDRCYVGTEVQLSGETLRIAWYNLTSSLPLTGRTEALGGLARLGTDGLPQPFSSPLTIACVLAGVGVVAARILLRPSSGPDDTVGDGADAEVGREHRRAESAALIRGALVALALTLGSAAVMSVSAQAPEIILGMGYPYRHIVVTWIGLCVAGVLLLIAVDLLVGNRVGIVLWSASAAVAVLVAGVMLPINLQSTRAENLSRSTIVTEAIHREVVRGDPSQSADDRRCATLTALAENRINPVTERFITTSTQWAYRYFYGEPYCSDIPESDPPDQ